MKTYLREKMMTSLRTLGIADVPLPTFEQPRALEHGDLTTNIAMVLAKRAATTPRQLAGRILESLELDSTLVDRIEIAGPGFINFHFTDKFYQQQLGEILYHGKNFGKLNVGNGKKTQVEFMRANHT